MLSGLENIFNVFRDINCFFFLRSRCSGVREVNIGICFLYNLFNVYIIFFNYEKVVLRCNF